MFCGHRGFWNLPTRKISTIPAKFISGESILALRRQGTDDLISYPWVEAIAITEPTFEKIVLMLDATPGMMAPAATATKPAIKAYSMRS